MVVSACSMNKLIEKFVKKEFSLGDVEEWAKAADNFQKNIKGDSSKVKYWKEILGYIREREQHDSKHYDKGFVYLRLAVGKLLSGKSYVTVLKYLKLSQKEARIKFKGSVDVIPEDTTPFRVAQILVCLQQYRNSEFRKQVVIDKHLNNPKERRFIHQTLCNIYDLTLESPVVLSLPWAPFDKLLGRNRYRAAINENYDAAVWLCERIDKIHRKTDLEQYGLAKAVIVLCGATIEGILAKNGPLQKNQVLKKKKRKTLGDWIWAYIDNLKSPPDLTIMFLFLLSIRNQIHPTNSSNKWITIDMRLALYVLRLTEGIILKLSKISRKRMKKY